MPTPDLNLMCAETSSASNIDCIFQAQNIYPQPTPLASQIYISPLQSPNLSPTRLQNQNTQVCKKPATITNTFCNIYRIQKI